MRIFTPGKGEHDVIPAIGVYVITLPRDLRSDEDATYASVAASLSWVQRSSQPFKGVVFHANWHDKMYYVEGLGLDFDTHGNATLSLEVIQKIRGRIESDCGVRMTGVTLAIGVTPDFSDGDFKLLNRFYIVRDERINIAGVDLLSGDPMSNVVHGDITELLHSADVPSEHKDVAEFLKGLASLFSI